MKFKTFIILFLIYSFSCSKDRQKSFNDEEQHLEEIKFLQKILNSENLIVPRNPNTFSKKNTIYLYDSLLSFKNIGISNDIIETFLKQHEQKQFNLNLNSKKMGFIKLREFELSLIENKDSIVTFKNSYYKISRVSFNEIYTHALVAIEFVCQDCGGLALYKFQKMENGDWKLESQINVWIS